MDLVEAAADVLEAWGRGRDSVDLDPAMDRLAAAIESTQGAASGARSPSPPTPDLAADPVVGYIWSDYVLVDRDTDPFMEPQKSTPILLSDLHHEVRRLIAMGEAAAKREGVDATDLQAIHATEVKDKRLMQIAGGLHAAHGDQDEDCDCDDEAIRRVEREEWHKAAIAQAGRHAQANPHLVDDYSDADPGL